ncbi:uncharacterized protein BDZ99DRAFT_461544, partial [Mytilinidion resinicola]
MVGAEGIKAFFEKLRGDADAIKDAAVRRQPKRRRMEMEMEMELVMAAGGRSKVDIELDPVGMSTEKRQGDWL